MTTAVLDTGAARHPAGRPDTTRRAVGVASAALGGAAVALQSRTNGDLSIHLRDGLAAATISFGTGLLLLLIAVPATRRGRLGLAGVRAALRARTLRPWHCLGGVCGAGLVLTQSMTVAVIGVAGFTAAMVAGQSGGGLLADRLGAGSAGPQPFTLARVAGAALAVAAVLVAVADRLTSPTSLGLVLLPVLAGAGIAWQQAVNGRVRAAAGSAATAAFISFLAGTAALLPAFGIDVWIRGVPTGRLPNQPWLYLGGALGVLVITLSAAMVRHTGVLLLGLGMIAGQLLGAVVIDVVAPAGAGPTPLTLTGAGMTLLAVLIAAVGRAQPAMDRPDGSHR